MKIKLYSKFFIYLFSYQNETQWNRKMRFAHYIHLYCFLKHVAKGNLKKFDIPVIPESTSYSTANNVIHTIYDSELRIFITKFIWVIKKYSTTQSF